MKFKKLVSLLAVLAISVSVFAGLTVQAENTTALDYNTETNAWTLSDASGTDTFVTDKDDAVADIEIAIAGSTNTKYNGPDAVSSNGIYWSGLSWSAINSKSKNSATWTARYIKVTPVVSGTFKFDAASTQTEGGAQTLYIYYQQTSDWDSVKSGTTSQQEAANLRQDASKTDVSIDMVAGNTYYIYTYTWYYGRFNTTISNLRFTPDSGVPTPAPTATPTPAPTEAPALEGEYNESTGVFKWTTLSGVPSAAKTYTTTDDDEYADLTVGVTKDRQSSGDRQDTITSEGIYWDWQSIQSTTSSTARYMKITPVKSGTFEFNVSITCDRQTDLYYTSAYSEWSEVTSAINTAGGSGKISATSLYSIASYGSSPISLKLKKGTTYIFYIDSFNTNEGVRPRTTISNLRFIPDPTEETKYYIGSSAGAETFDSYSESDLGKWHKSVNANNLSIESVETVTPPPVGETPETVPTYIDGNSLSLYALNANKTSYATYTIDKVLTQGIVHFETDVYESTNYANYSPVISLVDAAGNSVVSVITAASGSGTGNFTISSNGASNKTVYGSQMRKYPGFHVAFDVDLKNNTATVSIDFINNNTIKREQNSATINIAANSTIAYLQLAQPTTNNSHWNKLYIDNTILSNKYDIQDEVSYTVNYVVDNGDSTTTTVKTDSLTGIPGDVITNLAVGDGNEYFMDANNNIYYYYADNAANTYFDADGTRYFYVSSDDRYANTNWIAEGNVYTVVVRAAEELSLAANAVYTDAEGAVQTVALNTVTFTEGDTGTITYTYPKYITDANNNILAAVSSGTTTYSRTQTSTTSQVYEVAYDLYTGEGKFIEHETISTNGRNASDANIKGSANYSGSTAKFAVAEGVEAFTIEKTGSYKITVVGSNANTNQKNVTFAVYKNSVADSNLLHTDILSSSYNYVMTRGTKTSDNVWLEAGDKLIIQGNSYYAVIDYIMAEYSEDPSFVTATDLAEITDHPAGQLNTGTFRFLAKINYAGDAEDYGFKLINFTNAQENIGQVLATPGSYDGSTPTVSFRDINYISDGGKEFKSGATYYYDITNIPMYERDIPAGMGVYAVPYLKAVSGRTYWGRPFTSHTDALYYDSEYDLRPTVSDGE